MVTCVTRHLYKNSICSLLSQSLVSIYTCTPVENLDTMSRLSAFELPEPAFELDLTEILNRTTLFFLNFCENNYDINVIIFSNYCNRNDRS